MSEVFDSIYDNNTWSGTESRSGPGAGPIAFPLGEEIVRLVRELDVQSVLDVGSGDGFWMPDLPGYVGIDVSSRAVDLAKARHPDREYRVDTGEPYPHCDLVISRCVMQHLSYLDGREMLRRILESGPRWLLATTYTKVQKNVDINTGQGFWIDLMDSPFSLGQPIRLIDDIGASDDMGGMLGLWEVR